jgi:hypothetical protein
MGSMHRFDGRRWRRRTCLPRFGIRMCKLRRIWATLLANARSKFRMPHFATAMVTTMVVTHWSILLFSGLPSKYWGFFSRTSANMWIWYVSSISP